MAKLSKYEKESIINWNEAENTASIYTFNADLKHRLTEFSRKYPQLCWLERSTTEGSVTYVIEKSRLSVRLVPPYSEERLGSCQRVRQTTWFSGFAYRKGKRLITGQMTAKCRVCTRHFHSLFIQGYQVSSTIEDEKCPFGAISPVGRKEGKTMGNLYGYIRVSTREQNEDRRFLP